jgi:hypothetical protein
MNTASANSTLWPRLIAANLAILLILFLLEKGWGFRYEASKRILYEKIELIRPDRYPELLADLQARTGLKIKRVAIGKVNFLRDTADLTIYYDDVAQNGWISQEETLVALYANDAEN